MNLRYLVALAAVAGVLSCSNGNDESSNVTAPEPLPAASYNLTAQILGPVQNDDDADMRFTVEEAKGVWGNVNFVRMTCSNGASQEWGADTFAGGENRVPGGSSLQFVRHYKCRSSGRPREVLVDLTDDNGFHHEVKAAPFHPDWPGA